MERYVSRRQGALERPDYLRQVLPNGLQSGGAVRLREPVRIQIISQFQVRLQILVSSIHRRKETLDLRTGLPHELERMGGEKRGGPGAFAPGPPA